MAKKKKQHGGKRKGAGRPKASPYTSTAFRLPVDLAADLDARAKAEGCSRSAVILAALRAWLGKGKG